MAHTERRSWEGWATVDDHPEVADGKWDDEGPEDIDFSSISASEAGEMLGELLVSLKLSGKITAN